VAVQSDGGFNQIVDKHEISHQRGTKYQPLEAYIVLIFFASILLAMKNICKQ
jgi:hypothetical protein